MWKSRRSTGILLIIVTILVVLAVEFCIALAVMWWGVVNVGADHPHPRPVRWYLDRAMTYSVQEHAQGLQAPPPDQLSLVEGAGHYGRMCVVLPWGAGGRAIRDRRRAQPGPAGVGPDGEGLDRRAGLLARHTRGRRHRHAGFRPDAHGAAALGHRLLRQATAGSDPRRIPETCGRPSRLTA